MSGAVVFLGPSLPLEQARRHLGGAAYRPPVEQGDVLRAMADGPRVIGIIDGYFDLVPSVWHKEILAALSSGIHVFGASSMGALRAAELQPFGMVGIGGIFRQFADGALEDDDEVAVVHGAAADGYPLLSDAMVDIRDALLAAADAAVIGLDVAQRLIDGAKATHYRERSFRRVLEQARSVGDAEQVARLDAFLAQYGPRAKARDALAMLDAIDAFVATDPPPLEVAWRLQRTHFLRALEAEVAAPAP